MNLEGSLWSRRVGVSLMWWTCNIERSRGGSHMWPVDVNPILYTDGYVHTFWPRLNTLRTMSRSLKSLKRAGVRVKWSSVRKQSPQRSRDNAKYRHLKVKFLESHPYCFKCNDFIEPKYRSVHHWAGRTGALLCWVPGFRMLCLACHNWTETHRNDAVFLGLRASNKFFGRPSKVITM